MPIETLHIDTTELADKKPRSYDSTRHLYTATVGCPCDSCPQRTECRDNELSCPVFSAFVTRRDMDTIDDRSASNYRFKRLMNRG